MKLTVNEPSTDDLVRLWRSKIKVIPWFKYLVLHSGGKQLRNIIICYLLLFKRSAQYAVLVVREKLCITLY